MVSPADSTYAAIERKVRHLTNCPGENSLTSSYIQEKTNVFYSQDFPYAIKVDQMRDIYTFYTLPNIDRYPLDVNYDQGIRAPVYFDGIQGGFYKDRIQFFNLWPRITTQFQESPTTLTGNITGIAQPTNPTEITSVSHGLSTGAVVTLTGVGGMTQLNDNSYTITYIDDNTFSLDGIDNTAFGAYTTGGVWTAASQTFNFTLPGPFLSQEVQIGGVSPTSTGFSIKDNGQGRLYYILPNAPTSTPLQNTNPAIPGMYNENLGNPGLYNPTDIGSVDYVTGEFSFTLPSGVSLGSNEVLTIRVSQYQTGRPYSLLFWNNEFTIRPVPDKIHKVEVETYLTPVQFMQTTDHPIINQWWQYIAYGVACEIQRERNDFDGVEALKEGMMRQETMVLERQAVEEIGQPNYTLFNSTTPNPYLSNYWGQGWY